MKISSGYRYLLLIIFISLLLYIPSFFYFYTHDDFFHFLLAKTHDLNGFTSFFNIVEKPLGYGSYRPITTQVYYFFGRCVFGLKPFWMHLISFSFFAGLIGLVYKYLEMITKNRKTSMIGVFLYATSSIHFMNLYFLGAFQEIGMAFFVLLSVILSIKSKSNKAKKFYFSLVFFIVALMSKETAVITPVLIIISKLFVKADKRKGGRLNNFAELLRSQIGFVIPHIIILMFYLYFRIFHYGFAQGDSYIWEISPRVINTLFWYILWSFNIPEMLVDFVGPGMSVNPNLLRYWSGNIIPIFAVVGVLISIFIAASIKNIKNTRKIAIFSVTWFLVSLAPVMFLPLHKFVYYLTLPMIGFTMYIACMLREVGKKYLIYFFLTFWFIGSVLTLNLTRQTHWVTSGSDTAERVHFYFQKNITKLQDYSMIAFVDTEKDNELPWKPSEIVKASLSDKNYFEVFYPDKFEVFYGNEPVSDDTLIIEAREFIGY